MKKAIILFIISVVILISLLIYKSYTKSPIEPTQPAKKYIPVERLETVNYKKLKKDFKQLSKEEKEIKRERGQRALNAQRTYRKKHRECVSLFYNKDSLSFDSCSRFVLQEYLDSRL